ncbi:zinc finger MYM-type protein 1-like [Mercenaria mercenaria]|uniref:zinc finger MYM-type protein 1-like n=1 Tax=Mercenaria mercenaria TaxID=6596 RepID=UPI001E1D7C27|nr:zinc finger MYM-type protein 1-like [Mercenaria mercenaria]
MDIPPIPNQPKTFKFQERTFGQKNPVNRSFQPPWFANRTWLHYDETNELAYCHVCMVAHRDGKLSSSNLDKAFNINGFSNWKDASVSLKKHESSGCHHESVEKLVTLPEVTKDIGETLSNAHAEEKSDNRESLSKILSRLWFLGRQGLPIRGDGDENDRIYTQLLKLRGEDDSRVLEWLKQKNEKYTCAHVQNEMLQIMALSIPRDVAKDIRNCALFYHG